MYEYIKKYCAIHDHRWSRIIPRCVFIKAVEMHYRLTRRHKGTNESTDEYIILIHSKELLTHWGRVTHICVNKLTIIGSDNGLSPGRRQAIIWTNAGILLIGPLGTNNEILIEI